MSIRSIDLQVLIPRVTEVSKTQQISDNQRTVQQQHFTQEWRQISAQRQNQIQHTSQAEDGIIHNSLESDDSAKNHHNKRKNQAKKNSDELTEVNHDDPILGNIIDIKT